MSDNADAHRAGDGYWPQIDGLRAVAILLVVAFHAGVPELSGGFVGVDVFFVLSGYLITGLLVRELQRTGRIDLFDFYARRVRRLMPALIVVLLSTMAIGAVVLVPVGEQSDLAISAVAAILFLANVLYASTQSSYFAGVSEEIPLLHLWTLSVEEQFYIVWPLVIIAVATLSRDRRSAIRNVALAIGALSLASFIACALVMQSHPTSAFYLMHHRAWEFGIGAMLAFAPLSVAASEHGRRIGHALTVAGVAAILTAALILDAKSLFPGIGALLPVLGTAAAIAGVRLAPATSMGGLLASTPMVTIGKLSYSWYLWHWPLLALARAHGSGELSLWLALVLSLAALGLSALTYRFVEEPVRRLRPGPFATSRSSVLAGATMMAGIVALSIGALRLVDWQIRRDPVLAAAHEARQASYRFPQRCAVHHFRFDGLAPLAECATAGKNGEPLVVLWGDSMSGHHRPGLSSWAALNGVRALVREFGGCKPFVVALPAGASAVVREAAGQCLQFNAAMRADLHSLKASGAKAVMIAARWSVPSQIQTGLGDWVGELRALVAEIRALDLPVVLLAETAQQPRNVPNCIARRGIETCARPREAVDRERAAALAELTAIAATIDGVTLLDPLDALCSRASCPVVREGRVLYSDNIHLSVAGSHMLHPLYDRLLLPLVRSQNGPRS